jgi:hypothetical protein
VDSSSLGCSFAGASSSAAGAGVVVFSSSLIVFYKIGGWETKRWTVGIGFCVGGKSIE